MNERDRAGRTPLMVADKGGDEDIMMCLLLAGVDWEGLTEECIDNLVYHAYCECELLAV